MRLSKGRVWRSSSEYGCHTHAVDTHVSLAYVNFDIRIIRTSDCPLYKYNNSRIHSTISEKVGSDLITLSCIYASCFTDSQSLLQHSEHSIWPALYCSPLSLSSIPLSSTVDFLHFSHFFHHVRVCVI